MITMNRPSLRWIPLAMVLAVFGASGCATGGAAPQSDVVPVEVRAMERWDLLVQGDFAGAYAYLSPGYRSSVTSVAYQRRMLLSRISWREAEIVGSECAQETCKVRILLDYLLVRPVPGVDRLPREREIEEDWILADGAWFYVPD